MDIRYKVKLFTYWHCGSGLAAGADLDALVIKDDNGLPFIPGKTIKGLLREAMEDLIYYRYKEENQQKNSVIDFFITTFGYFNGKSEISGEEREMIKGGAFFTDAVLPLQEQEVIIDEHLRPFLYSSLSNTAINENGVAEEHSLRKTEVVIPLELEGEILNLPITKPIDETESNELKLLKDSFRYIKRLGSDRNRGLGRCQFSKIHIIDKDSKNKEG